MGSPKRNEFNHRGYVGSSQHCEDSGMYHGKVEGVMDLVMYESVDIEGLPAAFKEAVDDWLYDYEEKPQYMDLAG